MKRMNLVCGSWGEALLKDLNTMRESKEMCDVKLILQGGNSDVAHSSILAAASPFFKTILDGAENPELNMEDFPKDIIRQVLNFVYTGSVDVDMADLYMLHTVAVDLNIQILQDMVEQVMQTLPNYNDDDSSQNESEKTTNTEIPMKKEDTAVASDVDEDNTEEWTPDDSSIMSTPMSTSDSPNKSQSSNNISRTRKRKRKPSINEADMRKTSVLMLNPVEQEEKVTEEQPKVRIAEGVAEGVLVIDTTVQRGGKGRGRPKKGKGKAMKKKTVSHSVIIKPSTIPGANKGIFTHTSFPDSVAFGPYPTQKLDTEAESNWLKYVKFALTEEEQNVEAYEHKGYTFFRTCKEVDQDTELLLYFKNDEERERLGVTQPDEGEPGELGMGPIYLPTGQMFDPPETRFDCIECALAFVSEVSFHKHMRIKHSVPLPLEIYLKIEKGKKEKSDQKTPLKAGTTSETLIESIQSQRRKSSRRNKNKSDQHQCPICECIYTTHGSLKTHLLIHSTEKPYTCPICDRGFTQAGNLNTHLKIHTGEKAFTCDICNKGFAEQSNFRRHWRTHTGEKPFLCNTCGKSFSQYTHLETHTRTHTGERPFKCRICSKTFREKSSLAIHERRHGEKSHLCTICNKTFYTLCELQTHKKASHTT